MDSRLVKFYNLKKNYFIFCFCLGLFLLAFALLSNAGRVFMYWNLKQNGRPIFASITKLEPQNHSLVHYEYTVNGYTYTGAQSECGLMNMAIGQKISAFYVYDNPKISCLGNPIHHFMGELFVVLAASLLFSLAITIRCFFWEMLWGTGKTKPSTY